MKQFTAVPANEEELHDTWSDKCPCGVVKSDIDEQFTHRPMIGSSDENTAYTIKSRILEGQ